MLTDFNAVYDKHARRQWSILVRDVAPVSDFAVDAKGIGYYLGDVLQVIDRSEVKKYQLYLTDYISTLESFFRVRRRVLLADLYQAFDYPAFGSRGLRTLDYLKTLDSVALRKSLSPLFISLLLQRRIPIRYVTLVLTDYISHFDRVVYGKTDIGITDYLSLLDLSALVRSISPSFLLLLLQRRIPVRYLTLTLVDYVSLFDTAGHSGKGVGAVDYLAVFDYTEVRKGNILVWDAVLSYESFGYRRAIIESHDVFDMYEHIPSTDITVYNLWPTTYLIANVRDLLQAFDLLRYERKSYTVIVSDLISASDSVFSVKRNITSRELINTYENVRYGRS